MSYLDVNKPEDMLRLLETGLIWHGGPKTQQAGLDALSESDRFVTRASVESLPGDLVAAADEQRRLHGLRTLAETIRLQEDDGA